MDMDYRNNSSCCDTIYFYFLILLLIKISTKNLTLIQHAKKACY